MEMPEGWKRLRLKDEDNNFDCPCPICFSLDLMKEMADTLDVLLKKHEEENWCDKGPTDYGWQSDELSNALSKGNEVIKKFKEWK